MPSQMCKETLHINLSCIEFHSTSTDAYTGGGLPFLTSLALTSAQDTLNPPTQTCCRRLLSSCCYDPLGNYAASHVMFMLYRASPENGHRIPATASLPCVYLQRTHRILTRM